MPRISKALHASAYGVPAIPSESSLYELDRHQPALPELPSYTMNSTKSFLYDPYHEPLQDPLSPLQWHDSDPLVPDVSSFDSSDIWNSLSASHDQNYVPVDENNYLTWSYDVSNVNPSLYAPSILSSNPASPSMSILSASTEDTTLSPPPSLADFGNVFDFDFGASLPNESQAASQHWLQVPAHHGHSSHHHTFSNPSCSSPVQSSVSADCSESRPGHSREPSPNQSDNDQNNPRRRYPCLILGCTRRFTSQYTLKVHMEAHKPKPRVSFPCTLGCSEKFSRQHDRLRHEVAKHGKVCEFSCEECGRFFSTKKTLGNHKCPVAQGTRWVDG
ncbi:hypothetical protein NP233_g52 [Leucocoprinus birnbaumii]|uniref:C2H2-type domain-containing protein n=1 Tax=Leucocoprinus birnbaumii TaxID=56174 RepID=A0AAD5W3I4_9AGAR|nr:hypothetical protein NP233_g52 [Leucocoprinus birnbaumii]